MSHNPLGRDAALMRSREGDATIRAHMRRVVVVMRKRALRSVFDGHASAPGQAYINACRVQDDLTQTVLIFTRDTGHHSSGWMKNPDYERCWHLSTSPYPSALILPSRPEPDMKMSRAWLGAFFGADVAHVWSESPKSEHGRRHNVWHWRLFCDERWEPLHPRKEVYTADFIELGWRSASQVLEEEGRVIVSTVDPT